MYFYKKYENDTIWWVDQNEKGKFEFSFDKKKIYNLYKDYPFKMTKEEVEIFDNENPYWAHYFRGRREKWQTESK